MAIKNSIAVKNAKLDAVEAAIGAGAILKIRTGAPPSAITDADSGTVLASITLPSDWMAAASAGSKAKLGTWQGVGAAAGVAAHFRLYASDGSTQHQQGTVSATGGGGDLTLDNTNIAVDQQVTVTGFTWTEGN